MELNRFRSAQDRQGGGYAEALAEIRSGGKQGHWIWYVFPQLYGLGTSSLARAYGIRSVDEAEAYLRDSVLRSRLLEITDAVARQLEAGRSLDTVMGSSIDVLKLVSSLTLFGGVARRLTLEASSPEYDTLARLASGIVAQAEANGYPPCERTLAALESAQEVRRPSG
jgi:uncharacterized protein (DUF1810 family)